MTVRWRGEHHFDNLSVDVLTGFGLNYKGDIRYVDTVNGSNNNSGKSWSRAKLTMAAALAAVDDHGVVGVVGDIREQITAPLGLQGVRIVGMAGGRTRHDDGVRWREATVAGNAALITIREQGWEFHNILFVPQNAYAAIRAHRAESASYPDSSHFIVRGCKFIGPNGIAGAQGKGIEDWGGNHHYLVEECEFNDLEFAIVGPAGSPGIAAPLRDIIRRNIFAQNKHDICMDMSKGIVQENIFRTAFNGSTHPNTINLAYLSDVSGANLVLDNHVADSNTDLADNTKGFVPSTGDTWRNWAAGTVDPVVAVPS
jgi:hypothetical protein